MDYHCRSRRERARSRIAVSRIRARSIDALRRSLLFSKRARFNVRMHALPYACICQCPGRSRPSHCRRRGDYGAGGRRVRLRIRDRSSSGERLRVQGTDVCKLARRLGLGDDLLAPRPRPPCVLVERLLRLVVGCGAGQRRATAAGAAGCLLGAGGNAGSGGSSSDVRRRRLARSVLLLWAGDGRGGDACFRSPRDWPHPSMGVACAGPTAESRRALPRDTPRAPARAGRA